MVAQTKPKNTGGRPMKNTGKRIITSALITGMLFGILAIFPAIKNPAEPMAAVLTEQRTPPHTPDEIQSITEKHKEMGIAPSSISPSKAGLYQNRAKQWRGIQNQFFYRQKRRKKGVFGHLRKRLRVFFARRRNLRRGRGAAENV